MKLGGADSVRVGGDGALVIRVGSSVIRQPAPVAYQTLAGERHRVSASYRLDGRTARFAVGPYDHAEPLVIDPLVLGYSTYVGDAANYDGGRGVAVDSSGAAITGTTFSAAYPTQNPFQTAQGGADIFVTKINPDSGGAATLAYSTYLGGSGADDATGIAVDSAGAAYVAGITASTNFPTQDPFQMDPGDANDDVFVTKLDPDSGGAVTLAYSTYLTGGAQDGANAIAVDASGAAYVAGTTGSTTFTTQASRQLCQLDPGILRKVGRTAVGSRKILPGPRVGWAWDRRIRGDA